MSMRGWPAFVALPVIVAAAVCTTARRTETPAQSPAIQTPAQRPVERAAEAPAPVAPAPAAAQAPDFDGTVKPILEKQCRPCHFTGGVMYQKLPFDRAETIRTLGEKLFTRIKKPDEQTAIRAFLDASSPKP